jgi:phage gpG-like protein
VADGLANITFKLQGLPRVQRVFQESANITAKPEELLNALGNALQRDVLITFRTGTDPVTGTAWPRSRRAIGDDGPNGATGKTLVGRGDLLGSILTESPRISGGSVTIGTSWFSARVHQEGLTIRPKKGKYLTIPATKEAARLGARAAIDKYAKFAAGFYPKEGFPKTVIGYFKGLREAFSSKGRNYKSREGTFTVLFFLKQSIKMTRRRFLGIGPRQRKLMQKTTIDTYHRILGNQSGGVE